MSKPLQTVAKLGGMLTVLCSTAVYSPSKASAQSLLPSITLVEGEQICLAFCTSPRSTVTPSQALPSQGLGGLPAQVLQLPAQALQLPQQILSAQGAQILRSNLPVTPGNPQSLPQGNPQVMLPGNPQGLPPGNPQVIQQPARPVAQQNARPSFLQKIAPVLPHVIQQLSR